MAVDSIKRILDGFEKATAIPSNSDLNNFITPGLYGSPNTATTSTLSNCPGTGAFALIVLAASVNDTTTAGKRQIAVFQTDIYFRGASTNGWGVWKKVTATNA